MTADRRLVLAVYAALAWSAAGEFFYRVCTPTRWVAWLAMTGSAVMLAAGGLWTAVRSWR